MWLAGGLLFNIVYRIIKLDLARFFVIAQIRDVRGGWTSGNWLWIQFMKLFCEIHCHISVHRNVVEQVGYHFVRCRCASWIAWHMLCGTTTITIPSTRQSCVSPTTATPIVVWIAMIGLRTCWPVSIEAVEQWTKADSARMWGLSTHLRSAAAVPCQRSVWISNIFGLCKCWLYLSSDANVGDKCSFSWRLSCKAVMDYVKVYLAVVTEAIGCVAQS